MRKNVLMVLTHLILNDMVKVKGQISELALCLLDQDERIASLARLFFTEFAKKSSAPVYNLLPDIVSSLTNASLAPEEFREVLGFLIAFVGKDRQAESMVQKLCDRFDMSDAPRVHQDIAFCIGALSHTERSVLKLLEMQKSFVNKLGDDEVRACFVGLVKTRKAPGTKPELRKALDDLAALVEQTAQDAEEAEAAAPEQAAASAVVDEEAPASVDEPAADACKQAIAALALDGGGAQKGGVLEPPWARRRKRRRRTMWTRRTARTPSRRRVAGRRPRRRRPLRPRRQQSSTTPKLRPPRRARDGRARENTRRAAQSRSPASSGR